MPDRFDSALYAVPPRLREALQALPDSVKRRVFEIRLRCGQPVALTLPDGTGYLMPGGGYSRVLTVGALRADAQEVRRSFFSLCEYSVHVHEQELAAGFVSMRGGHRAGISGKMAVQNGRITSVGEVYGINIRIAREVSGVAAQVVSGLLRDFGGIEAFSILGRRAAARPPISGIPPGCCRCGATAACWWTSGESWAIFVRGRPGLISGRAATFSPAVQRRRGLRWRSAP